MLKSRRLRAGSADEDALAGCLVAILFLIFLPFGVLFDGFVLLQNYNWFLLPIHGAPVLTIGNCIGISLIVGMLTVGLIQSKKEDDSKTTAEKLIEGIVKMIMYPLVFWFFGWLYHFLFMR